MAVCSVWTEIALVSSTCAKESAIWGSDNLLTDQKVGLFESHPLGALVALREFPGQDFSPKAKQKSWEQDMLQPDRARCRLLWKKGKGYENEIDPLIMLFFLREHFCGDPVPCLASVRGGEDSVSVHLPLAMPPE